MHGGQGDYGDIGLPTATPLVLLACRAHWPLAPRVAAACGGGVRAALLARAASLQEVMHAAQWPSARRDDASMCIAYMQYARACAVERDGVGELGIKRRWFSASVTGSTPVTAQVVTVAP